MKQPIATAVIHGLLIGLTVISLFPLLWMLSVSFMHPGATTSYPSLSMRSRCRGSSTCICLQVTMISGAFIC